MSRWMKALAALVVVIALGVWLFSGNANDRALFLVEVAAPAQTLFVLIYGSGIWSQWWRSLIGRALFTKSLGLALLLDVSLANQWWGPYPHMEEVGLVVIALVALGAYLQLVALLADMRAGSRHRFSVESGSQR